MPLSLLFYQLSHLASNHLSSTIPYPSPLIRMEVPVGVSYNSDPREVERILLHEAEMEPLVEKNPAPAIRFKEFGESSLNFELLIWIDVRRVSRRRVRSDLYYSIFQALKDAGIEIPFPQRDVYVKMKMEAGQNPESTVDADSKSPEAE